MSSIAAASGAYALSNAPQPQLLRRDPLFLSFLVSATSLGCGAFGWAELPPNLAAVSAQSERVEIDPTQLRQVDPLRKSPGLLRFGTLEIQYSHPSVATRDLHLAMSEATRRFAELHCHYVATVVQGNQIEEYGCTDEQRAVHIRVSMGSGLAIMARGRNGTVLQSAYSYPEILGDKNVVTPLYEMLSHPRAQVEGLKKGMPVAAAITNPTRVTLYIPKAPTTKELALAGFVVALLVQPPSVRSWAHHFVPATSHLL
jgi:hypothetical protein